jgi:hypothetical protein
MDRSSGQPRSGSGQPSGGSGRAQRTARRPPQVPRRTGPRRQLRRALGVEHNALCRPIDRARSLVVFAVWALTAAAVAVAWLTALLALHSEAATAAQQRLHSHLVAAVTAGAAVGNAGDGYGSATSEAQASWSYPAGHPHTGPIDVPRDTPAGARVTTWVDDSGQATAGPDAGTSAVGDAVLAGWLALAGGAGAVTLVTCGALHALDRRADRAWDEDWARVEPGWSGRSGRHPHGTG